MTLTPKLGSALAFALLAAATGCASRAAPFDKLDQAQVTIMKVQQKPQTPALPGGFTLPGGFALPGVPPELVNQTLQQLQQSGLLPPGFQLPGMGGTQPGTPAMQPYANDPNFVIADQRPVVSRAQCTRGEVTKRTAMTGEDMTDFRNASTEQEHAGRRPWAPVR